MQPLGLHSQILPWALGQVEESGSDADHHFQGLVSATVFDCRRIDRLFLKDTGEAAWHETEETKSVVRLPFDACYFEFDDEWAVLAQEIDHYRTEVTDDLAECFRPTRASYLWDTKVPGLALRASPHRDGERPSMRPFGVTVEARSYVIWNPKTDGLRAPQPHFAGREPFRGEWRETWGKIAEFRNGLGGLAFNEPMGSAPFIEYPDIDDDPSKDEGAAKSIAEAGAVLLLGILALLNDHLVATEIVPDACPKLNIDRAKRGKTPLSCEHRVLTINTGAVRRAAQPHDPRQHESPRLHWRRGHWRALHRGSEFEGRTWVRRCLVGDPERGFVHKDYRLVWNLPLIDPTTETVQ